jgi:hypothetical protein
MENIARKTRQETFDAVVKHFAFMVEPAAYTNIDGNTSCLYRAGSGNKCFAGALIPDEDYVSNMEGMACNMHLVSQVLAKHGYETEFVRVLQQAHDEPAQVYKSSPLEWRKAVIRRLQQIKQNFELS